MAAKIKKIQGLEILDSRGNPTVRVRVTLSNGVAGYASVPSGASTGEHEAHELRDGNPKRYFGKGVQQAIKHVNTTIASALQGKNATKLQAIDHLLLQLDGTPHKSRLGANALLGVSLAVAHTAARNADMPLYRFIRSTYALPYTDWKMPIATMNVVNGGVHADWAMDFQEFMIVPKQKTMAARVRCGAEVFHQLAALLKKDNHSTLKGDEGGFAPRLGSNEKALQYIMKAIAQAGYKPGSQVALATDLAASEFYSKKKNTYTLQADGRELTTEQMIELVVHLANKYPFISIEDPLDQNDWDGWQKLTKKMKRSVALVGDDLFVTNVNRLQQGIDNKVATAILIKLNQIGTLTETINAIELAHRNGYKTSVSHRSGETEDTTISDLAVAVNSEFIKTGSLSRSERVAKYNRLLEIESELA